MKKNNTCFNKEKTYLIFGTGTTGQATAYFCIKHNLNFYITDDNSEKLKSLTKVINPTNGDIVKINEEAKIYNINTENEYLFSKYHINFIILSPSIHAQYKPHFIVLMAKKHKIEIIADIDLLYCYIKQKKQEQETKLVAITGTNGKSTTTSLTAFILNQNNIPSIACGNIGLNPLFIEFEKYKALIIEMSSYNLYLLKYAKFYCGALLNITEDHLNYHKTMKAYCFAKYKAIKNAKIKIICIDDLFTKLLFYRKLFLKWLLKKEEIILISKNKVLKHGLSWEKNMFFLDKQHILDIKFDNLAGTHNIENILSSTAVASVFGVSYLKSLQNTKNFAGLPHRIQLVRTVKNIDFINDSKATNANSTQKALQVFKNRKIFLIAGGQRKTDGFLSIKEYLSPIECVYLVGNASDSFSKELVKLKIKHKICNTIPNAVKTAFIDAKQHSNTHPVVLLSPLCASWDQYANFEERGEDFIEIVNKI